MLIKNILLTQPTCLRIKILWNSLRRLLKLHVTSQKMNSVISEKDLYYTGRWDLNNDTMLNSIESKNKIDLPVSWRGNIWTDNRISQLHHIIRIMSQIWFFATVTEFREKQAALYRYFCKGFCKRWQRTSVRLLGRIQHLLWQLKKTGIGKTAFERSHQKNPNPKKIKSGKYKIIVENLVSGNLLNLYFSAPWFFNLPEELIPTGKVNTRVASDKFSFLWRSPDELSFGSRILR